MDSAPSKSEAAARAAGQVRDALASLALEDRAALLDRVATDLESHREELVSIADEETSLGPVRLNGELTRTTNQLRLFASVLRDGAYLEATIDHADGSSTPPRPDLRRMLVPLGPVAVFTASNFPFAFSVAGGDTASALAAGCPVIVKAHSGHPGLSRRSAEIVSAAVAAHGLPEGTFGHVEGRQAGLDLVVAPEVKAVGFTGSLGAGRALFDLASGRPDPIPFYGELSSINPVVVTPGAAEARGAEVAKGMLDSMTLSVGQFCTKPGVVFVPSGHDLTDVVRDTLATDHTDAQPMLNDRIMDSFVEGLERLLATPSMEVVAGVPTTSSDAAARPIVFAIDLDDFRENRLALEEECFGPTAVLVRYRTNAQLEGLLEELPGALVACLHAEADELPEVTGIFSRLHSLAGRVVFDGWPTGVAVTWSMNHGGPWPATTNALHTSVGSTAIRRFLRPINFQDVPEALLPAELWEENPLAIPRRVDGVLQAP